MAKILQKHSTDELLIFLLWRLMFSELINKAPSFWTSKYAVFHAPFTETTRPLIPIYKIYICIWHSILILFALCFSKSFLKTFLTWIEIETTVRGNRVTLMTLKGKINWAVLQGSRVIVIFGNKTIDLEISFLTFQNFLKEDGNQSL